VVDTSAPRVLATQGPAGLVTRVRPCWPRRVVTPDRARRALVPWERRC